MFEGTVQHLDTLSILNSIPGNHLILLPDAPKFTIIAATDGYLNTTYTRRELIVGKGLFEVFPDNSSDIANNEKSLIGSLFNVIEQGLEDKLEEHRYTLLNESKGQFEKKVWRLTNKPVLNTIGELQYIIHTAQDITYQQEVKMKEPEKSYNGIAHPKPEESEERFRKLADDSPIFVFIIESHPDAPVTYWDKTWLDYTGQTMEAAVGRGWNGIIHPDDLPVVLEEYVPAFQKKQSYFIPSVRVKRYDGKYRWYAFKGNPRFSSNGNFSGYVGVGFEIHEQKVSEEIIKQSEAQLQIKVAERTQELQNQKSLFDNILKNSSNGISVTEMIRNENGEIYDANTILANESAIKYVGLPADVYLFKTAVELDPNILNSSYGQTCLKTLATGEPSLIQYYMEITGRWLELTISKMDDDHLIHIFTDVTLIKDSQLQLEKTIQELERSNTNLEDFAYAASHGLKEPIRKIRTFSEKLKSSLEGRLLDEDEQYFVRMEKATIRMQKLIDDLLEYSHVSNATDYSEEIDLGKKVALVLEDLEVEIGKKNAKIIVGSLPVIKGHRRQMQQLFQNLITNALKFSKPGVSPEIRISSSVVSGESVQTFHLHQSSKSQLYNLIEVSDNGIGFEQEYADQIFKMFQQLHGKAEYEGTGIGLAIVRKVVDNYKGFIRAEGKPGEGATFQVLLPLD